jgi:hypothetical protein
VTSNVTPTRDVTAPPAIHSPQTRWMALATVLLGLGAAAISLLGPLVTGTIEYHASDNAVNQIAGGDFAGLFLVAPVSLASAFLLWRQHRAGPVLAIGPAFYALYMYSQLAVSGDLAQYPGNSERFFLLYLGLFVLAGGIAIRAWSLMEGNLPTPSRKMDRGLAWFLIVVAVFLTLGLHAPGLVDAWSEAPTSTEYLADPVVFWLVKFMDLGIVVPALMATAIGILGERRWAARARYAACGWTALLGSSVAGMAIVMQATGDPAAGTANTLAFTSFALIALGIAWRIYLPLFRMPKGDVVRHD